MNLWNCFLIKIEAAEPLGAQAAGMHFGQNWHAGPEGKGNHPWLQTQWQIFSVTRQGCLVQSLDNLVKTCWSRTQAADSCHPVFFGPWFFMSMKLKNPRGDSVCISYVFSHCGWTPGERVEFLSNLPNRSQHLSLLTLCWGKAQCFWVNYLIKDSWWLYSKGASVIPFSKWGQGKVHGGSWWRGRWAGLGLEPGESGFWSCDVHFILLSASRLWKSPGPSKTPIESETAFGHPQRVWANLQIIYKMANRTMFANWYARRLSPQPRKLD